MAAEEAMSNGRTSELRTILIVDDDREAVIEIADLLTTRGLVFAGYVEAEKALERIDRDPTVVGCFVDLLMPGINGVEFIRRVRGLGGARAHIPLVAVTGLSDKRFLDSALQVGAMRVLRKPVDPRELRDALDAMLGASHVATQQARTVQVPAGAPAEVRPDAEGELQKLRLELELARRARTEFLGIVNHELRTPLNGVMGLAGLLQSNAATATPQTVREYSTQIIECGEQLLRQIERILELSAERSSEPLDQLEIVGMEDIIASACRQVGHLVAIRKAELHKPASMPTATMLCRPNRIARCLALVIENAIKFGATPPVVTITVAYRNTGWLVSVIDNGKGMAAAEMASAFDAFHLGDSTHTRRHDGLGIGLTLARRYAQEQGGDIRLSNRPEGGLQADISLPSNPAAPMQTAADVKSLAH